MTDVEVPPPALIRVEIAPTPVTRAAPSRRMVFLIVTFGLFMSSVDASIVATALPAIHRSLHASINWAGWTITIYSLTMVIALPIAGRFSDQFGRRRVFTFGVALFTVASLACGFATDIYMLIVLRALQAVGGAALQPSAAGLVADHFGNNRDRALGMFSTINSSGSVTGPIFGGLIVTYLSWRWIFFVNVPIGIGLMLLILRFIPASRPLQRAKTDVPGLALLAMCILAANFGITSLGNRSTRVFDPVFVVPEVGALVLLGLFVRHTKRTPTPFIPVQLLRAKGFATMNIENLLIGVAVFGAGSLVPLYAEERFHFHALSAGSLLTARGIGAIVIGTCAALALRRTGYRMPMVVGFLIIAIGTFTMSIAPRFGLSPYVWLSIGAGITGFGSGAANPASRNACMQLARDQVAAITGLRSMFNYIGIIFGVSITTAILNRSATPGLTQAHVMWVLVGILILVMIPLVYRVPEHKGSW